MIEVRLLTAQDKRVDFSCGNIEPRKQRLDVLVYWLMRRTML